MNTINLLMDLKTEPLYQDGYVARKGTPFEVSIPPCETCANYNKCKNEFLACRLYAVWMNSQRPDEKKHSKIPNRRTYKRLFGSQIPGGMQ